jgi:hypothetical protein
MRRPRTRRRLTRSFDNNDEEEATAIEATRIVNKA